MATLVTDRWYIDADGNPMTGLSLSVQIATAALPAGTVAAGDSVLASEIEPGHYAASVTRVDGKYAVVWPASGELGAHYLSEVTSPAAAVVLASATPYSPSDPPTDLDRVRLEIGDIGNPVHFPDWAIAEKISQRGAWELAAVDLLRVWARQLGQQPQYRVGRFSENWGAAAGQMNEQANELERRYAASHAQAFAGGISKSDAQTRRDDPDRPASENTVDMMDNPNASWNR